VARHRIQIAREQYKFSCAHMTVFPDGTKERLHGHNYTVALALDLARIDFASMIPFATIKRALATLTTEWKERVLLAELNPFFVLAESRPEELEFTLCGARYVMPRADALILPIDNITVEALAAHVAELLRERLAPSVRGIATQLEVTISEHAGQGASCAVDI
jgi:6-pyruvoyltetrahydropterin/6-carboxytetrahydropterin synthase